MEKNSELLVIYFSPHQNTKELDERFKDLYDTYYPLFFVFALGILKNEMAAEDVVQDVFCKILQYRQNEEKTEEQNRKTSKEIEGYWFLAVRNKAYKYYNYKNKLGEKEGQILKWFYSGGLEIPVYDYIPFPLKKYCMELAKSILSPMEFHVYRLIIKGYSNPEIVKIILDDIQKGKLVLHKNTGEITSTLVSNLRYVARTKLKPHFEKIGILCKVA